MKPELLISSLVLVGTSSTVMKPELLINSLVFVGILFAAHALMAEIIVFI
jgi:hypothetical protein